MKQAAGLQWRVVPGTFSTSAQTRRLEIWVRFARHSTRDDRADDKESLSMLL